MGRSFLNEFYHYQAGRPPLLSFVGFDFDHKMPEEKACERVAEVLNAHPSACSFFLNSRDLLLKDSIKSCLKSQKIFLLNDTGDAEKWRSFLIEKLQIDSSKIEVL
ncbi:MAG: hypothetical protein NXH75_17460, partial [Halobacteriovoraceae bacterium]|nr:hypothetical protein [Halobacteriovoraceae bacterium]